MSVNRRLVYCNDCRGKENPWKIVEVASDDAYWYNIKRAGCRQVRQENPCHCYENSDNAVARNQCNEPRNNACTYISVKNPQTELIIPELTTSIAAIGTSVDLAGWTDIIVDALDSFDNITGTYVAPDNGDYQVALTVNYETSVVLNVDTALNNVPTIEVYDVDTGLRILGSQFPTTNIVVVVPPASSTDLPVDIPVASILAKGQVIINAVIPLRENQRIRVRALTNGLVYFPAITPLEIIPPLPARIVFDPAGVDTTLTINRVRNSPIVTVYCNN